MQQRKNSFVKIVVYVPVTHAKRVREALAKTGAGRIGNYDACSFSMRGIGRFRPLSKAKPFVGSRGKITEIAEERIEALCPRMIYKKVVQAVRKTHPYEEPAIDVLPLFPI